MLNKRVDGRVVRPVLCAACHYTMMLCGARGGAETLAPAVRGVA